ncbi:hypothetical protein G3I44_09425 [Halogeometricum borinquense]|uniref:Uncharacterized protein n=1 Tax=Halogeometricum borinquense TaxID=60847 RepID=A0A6C0UG82_9EURY|nr:hypothetical protein [Halogeometricum borinquense]QIB74482.1 hypothetical protein G3I44_09425 [Halogeometricum borinquense]
MRERFAGLFGLGIGAALGYLVTLPQGDGSLGVITAIVWAIAGKGLLTFPEYWTGRAADHSKFWYGIIGFVTPLIILITPDSAYVTGGLPTVVLLSGIWLGGIHAGVALERENTNGDN